MPTDVAVGFWSYAHGDNELDNGAILQLANSIREEFDLLSGEQLKLFVDRSSIEWGDAWRERINSALLETTLFIPIITPRYFTRPECRRELLEFAAKVKSLGVEEFLLPILYVKPAGMSEESNDEAVALVASIQYVDWQRLRLKERLSSEYKEAINALAVRLIDIAEKVAERQLDLELSEGKGEDAADGLVELVERISTLMPDWLDSVLSDRVVDAQIHATWSECIARVDRLRRSHASASTIAAAQFRTAREMLPILTRLQGDAKVYLDRSIELDPMISALARLVADHPESYSLAQPVREAVDEAIINISQGADERTAGQASTVPNAIIDHFEQWRHLGRIFQKCLAISRSTGEVIVEGNGIVRRWDSELRNPITEPGPELR